MSSLGARSPWLLIKNLHFSSTFVRPASSRSVFFHSQVLMLHDACTTLGAIVEEALGAANDENRVANLWH